MINTTCLQESMYLLKRGFQTRGYNSICTTRELCVSEPGWTFTVSFMPGNRRILISHGVRIDEGLRGKGLGRKLLKLREEIAREAGVNLLLATVRDDNEIEQHLLITEEWVRLIQRDTEISLWGKQLV